MTRIAENKNALVEIDGLVVNFYTYQGVVQAIEGVDLVIRQGETLGLVGETGCGKSVTASSIMRLILSPPGKVEEGSIYFMEPPEVRARRKEFERQAQDWYARLSEAERRNMIAKFETRFVGFKKRVKPLRGEEIAKRELPIEAPTKMIRSYMQAQLSKVPKDDKVSREALSKNYNLLSKSTKYMQKIRGKFISMIFQEPTSALNPVFTAGNQIGEVILQHRKVEMAGRVLKRLEKESAQVKKDAKAWETEVNAWYGRLSDYDRRVMVSAYGSALSRYRKRGMPVTEDILAEVIAPPKAPPSLVKAYIKKKRRPQKWVPDKTPGNPPSDRMYRCSMCGAYVSRDDIRCEECDAEFYGRVSWLFRPIVLGTYTTVMHSIEKNPDAKQNIISRVPGLNRYRKELEKEAYKESIKMLETVRIPDPKGVASRFPFELSGGMQQRVMIAIALACNPRLLIADEPTTALDVTIQGQILKLMRDLKSVYGSSILLITHNLGVVAEMCDRVGVMYAGSMAEIGSSRDIFKNPMHPYSVGLMKSVPSIQMGAEKLYSIRGSVPNLIYPPNGCRFHPRCDFSRSYCTKVRPGLKEIEPGHSVACHMAAKEEGYVHGS